ncbi:uncharacterized [Tachysurus ichikawai]
MHFHDPLLVFLFWTAPLHVDFVEAEFTFVMNAQIVSFPLEFKRAVTMATLEEEGHLDAADDVGCVLNDDVEICRHLSLYG